MRRYLLLLAAWLAVPAGAQPFSFRLDALWSFRAEHGTCVLEQPVRDFGHIRFVGAPGAPLRLEVAGHREVFGAGEVALHRVAPPWHPDHPDARVLGSSAQRAGSLVLVADPLATRVLMSLYQGYEAHLRHAAWYGGDAALRIGNEHLRPQYEAFARCVQNASAAGWPAFQRTRVEYPTDVHQLRPSDRERLCRVAEFAGQDPQITRVYVDGHTDDVGSRQRNLRLSKRRAETVAEHLAGCGLPRERLVVRYHGYQYPVADGEDDESRARNRRTTVRLERAGERGGAAR